jgi:hypothetical protein
MRKLSVTNSVTLDGVMQAPGGPDEDRRGGFEHGGWAAPFNDSVMAQKMGEGMAKKSELLFGRRTYENFASYWPFQWRLDHVIGRTASRRHLHSADSSAGSRNRAQIVPRRCCARSVHPHRKCSYDNRRHHRDVSGELNTSGNSPKCCFCQRWVLTACTLVGVTQGG